MLLTKEPYLWFYSSLIPKNKFNEMGRNREKNEDIKLLRSDYLFNPLGPRPLHQLFPEERNSKFKLKHPYIQRINQFSNSDITVLLTDIHQLPRLSVEVESNTYPKSGQKYLALKPKFYFRMDSGVFALKKDIEKELHFVAKYNADPDIRSRYLFLSIFGKDEDILNFNNDGERVNQLKEDVFTTVERILEPVNMELNKGVSEWIRSLEEENKHIREDL